MTHGTRRECKLPTCTLAVVLLLGAMVGTAGGADWPQWLGPDRDGLAHESSGFPAGWPPARLWQKRLGPGCASPILVGGRLYVMDWRGRSRRGRGTDTLYCLDAVTGRELWKQSYPCPYQGRLRTGDEGAYGGPLSTPTWDTETGWLYTLSVDGDLRCWDPGKAGRSVWTVNLHETCKIRRRPDAGRGTRDYGHTGAPLIYGDLLIVEAGSTEGAVMAFEKRTGRRRWASEFREPGGHSSGPVRMKVRGVDCLASLALFKVVVMRIDKGHEGRTVATFPWQTDFANNIATPAVWGSRLIVTSDYNVSRLGLIEVTMGSARQRWSSRDHSKVCSPVVYRDRVFTVDKSLKCLDVATGRRLWRGGSFGHGSCLVTADEKVIVWGNGKLALVEGKAGTEGYRELCRIDRIARGVCYPHVCLADGIIVCKDKDGQMAVFSVRPEHRARAVAAAKPSPSARRRPPPVPAGPARPKSQTDTLHDAAAPKMAGAWPGARAGLVFLWAGAAAKNEITDAAGKAVRVCRLKPRGRARTNADGAMDLAGGAMLAEGADEALLAACRQSHQLAVEARITPARPGQTGPARIISFSTDPYHRNFTIGQEGDKLVFRLRTPRTGENGMNPETTLCRLRAGKTHHVIVSYSPGRLTCYLDGRRVLDTDRVRGDFSNWSAQHLLFGDEWRQPRDWAGTVAGVAVHSRVIGAAEAGRRFKLAAGG